MSLAGGIPANSIAVATSDGKVIPLSREAASQCGLIHSTVSVDVLTKTGSVGSSESGSGGSSGTPSKGLLPTPLPLPQVDSRVLLQIKAYLDYHAFHPPYKFQKPLRDDIYGLNIPVFDLEFIEKGRTQQDIYDIVTAAM